jgi:hypothetical protein
MRQTMRWTFLQTFIMCVSVFVCSDASRANDWGPFSLRLSEDMTEQQVINVIGYQPNQVTLETCGNQSSNGPWECRILIFGSKYNGLTILERRNGPFWVVNSWFVDP